MRLPFLLEPAFLHDSLADERLLIVDFCTQDNYRAAHIPGAININAASLMCGVLPAAGKLPTAERLSALFSAIGLKTDSHVVCYDDEGGPWAGRFIWIMDSIGHTKYSLLNGGKIAWQLDGLPLQSGENFAHPTHVQVGIDRTWSIDKEEILARLKEPDFLVWDVRSHDEYAGTKAQSARGGHIPGAIRCEWTDLLDKARGLRFRADIAGFLRSKGIIPEKHIVTHCQTHRRSGLSYAAARSLGYPSIRAYDGSWSEWGNCDDLPVNTGELP